MYNHGCLNIYSVQKYRFPVALISRNFLRIKIKVQSRKQYSLLTPSPWADRGILNNLTRIKDILQYHHRSISLGFRIWGLHLDYLCEFSGNGNSIEEYVKFRNWLNLKREFEYQIQLFHYTHVKIEL